jgi:hypothetical protein
LSGKRLNLSGPNAKEVAKEINGLHEEIALGLRTTLAKAIRIGELLVEQKEKCDHGNWLPWIEANLNFDPRTAQRYMRVFENRDRLKNDSVSYLSDAYQLLADERPDPESVVIKPPPIPIKVSHLPTEPAKPIHINVTVEDQDETAARHEIKNLDWHKRSIYDSLKSSICSLENAVSSLDTMQYHNEQAGEEIDSDELSLFASEMRGRIGLCKDAIQKFVDEHPA